MPPKKAAFSKLVKHSRELRTLAQKEHHKCPLLLAPHWPGTPRKSANLCRNSDELLRKSHDLRDQFRRIRNAA